MLDDKETPTTPIHSDQESKLEHLLDINEVLLEVEKGQKQICRSLQKIEGFSNKIVLVGVSGVGKSTLFNYLDDQPLKVVDDIGNLIIQGGQGIGHLGATTILPNFLDNRRNDFGAVDCPGFCDTRGVPMQIGNAFYLQTLFNGFGNYSGIENFVIAIVANETDVFQRAFGLSETIKNMVQLVGDPNQIRNNTLLIISKTRPSCTIQNIRAALIRLRERFTQHPNNRSQEIMRHIALLDILSQLDDNQILLFPKPQSEGEFHPRIKQGITDSLSTLVPLNRLNAHIIVSNEIKLHILTMINTLKERMSYQKNKIIEDIQTSFNKKIADIATHRDLESLECRDLLSHCRNITNALLKFSKTISSTAYGLKIDDHLSIVEELFQLTKTLQKTLNYEGSENYINAIRADLIQLRCCGNIDAEPSDPSNNMDAPPPYDRVNYSDLQFAITNFVQAIQETEKILLSRYFEFLNKTFKVKVESLTQEIVTTINNIEYSNITQLIGQYQLFKSAIEHFSANNSDHQPLSRINKFKETLLTHLQTAIKQLQKNDAILLAAEQMQITVDELFVLHKQYSDSLGNTQHSLYIQCFREYYQNIIECFEREIKTYITKDVKKMEADVRSALRTIDRQCIESMGVDEQKIPEVIAYLRKSYNFFDKVNKRYKEASEYKSDVIHAIKEATGGALSDFSLFQNAEGLQKLSYTFKVLRDLEKEELILADAHQFTAQVEEMQKKIKQLLLLIKYDNLPLHLVNISGSDAILEMIMEQRNQSHKSYFTMTSRYERFISREITQKAERFCDACVAQAYDNKRTSNIIKELKSIQAPREEAIHTFEELQRKIKNNSYFTAKSSLNEVIHEYKKFQPFFKENNKAFLENHSLKNPLDKNLAQFLMTLTNVLEKLTKTMEDFSDQLIQKIDSKMQLFFTQIDSYAVRNPKKISLLLEHLNEQFNYNNGPWDIYQTLESHCHRYNLKEFNFFSLKELVDLHKKHRKFLKNNPYLYNHDLTQTKKAFWDNLNERRASYPKPRCCYTCCTGCFSFWRRHRKEETLAIDMAEESLSLSVTE